jgi:hypothetical protein
MSMGAELAKTGAGAGGGGETGWGVGADSGKLMLLAELSGMGVFRLCLAEFAMFAIIIT